jgi:alkaline phosphatase D
MGRAGRGLIPLALLGLLAGAAVALATPTFAPGDPAILVTLGDVTDAEAVLWLRGHRPGAVSVEIAPAASPPGAAAATTLEMEVSTAGDLVAKPRLSGLRPATRYRYTVRQDDEVARGDFVTAPAADDSRPVSLAWSADLGSRMYCRQAVHGYPIFKVLARTSVDFFVFAGDTVYADQGCAGPPDRVPGSDFAASTLEQFRTKHRYNRSDPGVQAFFRRTAVYATWDDHEVRNDFAGPTEPLMRVGRQAFLDYFPIAPPAEEPGRLYRRFRWGQLVEVFMLDTRQYRSPNAQRDGPGKTMLGAAQKRWLIDGVTSSSATWKIVVSSVSLSIPTGRRARDSWTNANLLGFPEEGATGFAVERDAILRAFRTAGVRNLVFLAADVHHAELLRHHPTPEWSFHEFTAGPLSATLGIPRPVDSGLNSRSLFATGSAENFGEISVDKTGLTVRIVDVDGRIRFTHTIGAD